VKGKLAVLAAVAAAYFASTGAAGQPAPVLSGPITTNSNEMLANKMAASGYGWSGGQLTCLDELWTEESGFSAVAVNGSSGATGIPQLLPSAHAIPADWSNPKVQIKWGLNYIDQTYGSPCKAWAHEKSETPNWY
jgi:hypothetical protein